MYLKRLELVGFKTFADRTELEFGPGITAIVGPNGAGKSNLFDAIRWVLGETSHRALRAHRTEDVIFAGTSTRRPHGIAQVELTLDNGSGILPLEFSEVTVIRRATRASESEFFINRIPCRMRDVQALFLGTGLGGRSYAMIAQGEVEAILEASPQERRAWLLEAAGIARYHRRRQEAERRLQQAQENLERLRDLLQELETQRASLAAQAEAASRYRACERALREVEKLLHVEAARRLTAQIQRLAAQHETVRERYAEAERRAQALDGALREKRQCAEAAAVRVEAVQRELLSTVEAARACEARLQLLAERLRTRRERDSQLAVEIPRLARELAVLREAEEEARTQRAAVEAEIASARRAEAEVRRQVEALTEVVRIHREEEERLRADLVELEHARAQTQAQHAALHSRLQALRAQRKRLEERLARAEEERRAAQARREALEAQVGQGMAQGEVLRGRAEMLRERIQRVEAELERVQAEEREVEMNRSARLERLRYLEEAQAGLVGYEQAAREILLARGESPELQGVQGALVDFLEVELPHRHAVEAALGPALFALLADSLESARIALRWLQDRASGARFLIPELLCVSPNGSSPPEGAIPALELLRCPPQVAPFVAVALAETWVVRDLETALTLRSRGVSGRLVTLAGEVLSPEGVLATRRVNPDHPLGRAQELEALRGVLADLLARWKEVRRQRGALEQQRDALRAELQETTRALQAMEIQLASVRRALVAVEEDLARVDRTEAELRSELEAVESEAQETRDALQRVDTDLASVEAELERVRTAFHAARERLSEGERTLEAARAEHTRVRLHLVGLQGLWEALHHRVEHGEEARRSVEEHLAAARAEQAALLEEARCLLREQAEARGILEALRAREEALRGDLEAGVQERDRAMEEAQALVEASEAAWEEVRGHEEVLHRIALRRAQVEAEYRSLAQRVAEEFGIDLPAAEAAAPQELPREELVRRAQELRAQLEALGPVNLRAMEEHARLCARLEGLRAQVEDIERARSLLLEEMERLGRVLDVRFRQTLEEVDAAFGECFRSLFGGGNASLEWVAEEDGEEGIEIRVQVPGKKVRDLGALSGGERAMAALALIFALLRVHPSPFCVFDEVEAALDDENTRRLAVLLRELAQRSQVIIITHNKGTMEAADTLYGVTMEEPGVSRIVSVRVVEHRPQALPSSPAQGG
ncbi:MAG: chromosome segregation protein SMC [Armatimonadetes bacterium]|nr:chromosome segregation protein SMC [Armatimonadota bacterium]MDW8153059.1 chromosome segregation protein SMC [Armatimonadota bacterium]